MSQITRFYKTLGLQKLWWWKFRDQFHVYLCRGQEYSTPGALSYKCTLHTARCTLLQLCKCTLHTTKRIFSFKCTLHGAHPPANAIFHTLLHSTHCTLHSAHPPASAHCTPLECREITLLVSFSPSDDDSLLFAILSDAELCPSGKHEGFCFRELFPSQLNHKVPQTSKQDVIELESDICVIPQKLST